MADVHPTAILEGEIDLADDAEIGPYCVLRGPVRIGTGTRLIGSVYVQGPARIGARNVVYPFACLGFAPQHARYDPAQPGHGVAVGDDNTFREHVTVHRAFTDEGPTTIGSGNFFMASSHCGHDCRVGDGGTFVQGAVLAGHVTVGDNVMMGGMSGVHQFCQVGRHAMLAGGFTTTKDVPPFFTLTGPNTCGSVNLVGMRRAGMSRDDIEQVRWVFKTLYRRGLSHASALETLRERADEPLVAEFVRFIEQSSRGISRGHVQAQRGGIQQESASHP
ncbi:MAG: acyl-ACP--UDP-N-acetylglucosamine O-acyltransferase [Planctomycetota bacterium]|jgi:UDP-N-acetylglucosamine acyltransferase